VSAVGRVREIAARGLLRDDEIRRGNGAGRERTGHLKLVRAKAEEIGGDLKEGSG
jgi:hypothetical protein